MSQQIVREQGTASVSDYRKRVNRLATIYAAIVVVSVATIALIVIQGKLFVTLSQRSNVETLTLAFIILLLSYLTIVSFPGFVGALKIVAYNLPAWLGRDRRQVEARKQQVLTPKEGDASSVYLNVRVHREGHPHEPVELPLVDEAGSLGTIVVDGTEMRHEQAMQQGSNSVFAFFEQRIQHYVRQRDPKAKVEIVEWATIDDEKARQYESLVLFTRRLEEHLQAALLWPAVDLADEDIVALRQEATALCPILRDEAHLPDLEYSAEHRLPIIPEPLGFIALSRRENRADPVASMGCALIVAVVIFAIVGLVVLLPPWVPAT